MDAIYWVPSKFTGIKHVSYSLLTMCVVRHGDLYIRDIRKSLEKIPMKEVKEAGVAR